MLLASERGETMGIMPMVVMGLLAIGLFFFIASTAASPFAAITGGGFGFSNAPQVQSFKTIMNVKPSGTVNTGIHFDNLPLTEDPSGAPDSPFNNNITLATSTDGKIFSGDKVILEHAIPATALQQFSGRILIYGYDGAKREPSGIAVALTDTNGRFWRRGSVRIDSSLNTIFRDIDAINTSTSTIRLFYLGASSGTKEHPVQNVYSAVSHDGINFKEEPGIRYTDADISNPDVTLNNGIWVMHLKQRDQIITTISEDGKFFTLDSTMHDAPSAITSVRSGRNESTIFYCDDAIRSAISDDFTWENVDSLQFAPVMIPGCHIAVVKTSTQWLLFYPTQR